jgi:5-methylcytosine-specific restriction endonuclease McrA
VDHRIALVNGGNDFNEDPKQAQALCATCHKVKTAEDLGHKPQRRIGADGWPIAE